MILLYNASPIVYQVLEDLQQPYQVIEDTMLQETLGFLFGLPIFTKSEIKKNYHFDFDVMILHDIEDDSIQIMIDRLKAVNANIARKAVLTQHNQHWTMGDLLQEINEEHTFFQYYDKIVSLLKDSDKLHPDDYETLSWQAYEQAFVEAYQVVQSKPDSIATLKSKYQNLLLAKEALQKKN